jgi:beta-xylosidase
MMKVFFLLVASVCLLGRGLAQELQTGPSQVWNPDLGDGRYKNPILFADYSDPDVIRIGRDFYLVASSFDSAPALPLLHSVDLVHWQLIGHALARQVPEERYATPQHGNGVWAPSVRFHAGEFYIFYPDPDFGIYMIKAKAIAGPWSEPKLVKAAKGWIDPCPLWDDDGKAYLVNALAGSRAGAKSVILVSRMSADGTQVLDAGTIAIDGHGLDDTLEGPKIYKRGSYYFIFAPSGGVVGGSQIVFRSRSIYGPYERRVVLAQGTTPMNGPHQGAWVNTAGGEDWFIHFQDRGPYGRVTNLEPMKWGADGWPLIGVHQDAQGKGEPVLTYRSPQVSGPAGLYNPADSDEFNAPALGLQWAWQANPGPTWAFPAPGLGVLRLIDTASGLDLIDLRALPNVLLQKFPAPAFTATTKVHFVPRNPGDQTGLVVLGKSYGALILEKRDGEQSDGRLTIRLEERAAMGDVGSGSVAPTNVDAQDGVVYLRASVIADAKVQFSFSTDGNAFQPIGLPFAAEAGVWIGARIGIYAAGTHPKGEFGYADYDWFRFTPK